MTKVNYVENPSKESRQTTKKVRILQVKCPSLLTGRSQTYIFCTK